MILPDVNILVYAHRSDTPTHQACRTWLENLVNSDTAYGLSDIVLSGFLRIVTHPRIFRQPSPIDKALAFVEELRSQPHCMPIRPGQRHWEIFVRLCRECAAKGNLVADAFLAALAIEWGCECVTTDRDFSRFTGLRWRHPPDVT
jgi:toxin-antitoxin system PIN domain toxin